MLVHISLWLRRLLLWASAFLMVAGPYGVLLLMEGKGPPSFGAALIVIIVFGLWSFGSANWIGDWLWPWITRMDAPYLGSAGIGIFFAYVALHIALVITMGICATFAPATSANWAIIGYGAGAVLFAEVTMWDYEEAQSLRQKAKRSPPR